MSATMDYRQAFEVYVYVPYRDAVYRLALRKMPNADFAEDAVQEVFARALQAFGQVKEPGRIREWLFGIAGNVMADTYRQIYQTERHNDAMIEARGNFQNNTPMELRVVLLQEIGTLPETLQETLLLSFEDDLSSREIAERLDIAEGTVRWRLSEARRELKSKLVERLQDKPELAVILGIGEETNDLTAR